MKLPLLTIFLITHAALAWEGFASNSASSGESSISVDRTSQNGNTVTKTRRMLDNGNEKVVVTVSSPSVKIDGDECELNI